MATITKTEHKSLTEALAAFQAELKGAKRDSTNPFFNSKYSDLESVWEAAREAKLAEHGLSVSQPTKCLVVGDQVVTVLVTKLYHTSGQEETGELPLFPVPVTPQAQGSALTYARRYALAAILGIYQVDDDAEEAQRTSQRPKQESSARPTASTTGVGASSANGTLRPPCPECGKPLRQDREHPNEWYCWKKDNGCGYKGPKEGDPGNYSTQDRLKDEDLDLIFPKEEELPF